MNKILILCLGILIITLPCSTEKNSTNPTPKNPDPPVASAAGLGPWPTTLCLLIPPAILAFIHSRS